MLSLLYLCLIVCSVHSAQEPQMLIAMMLIAILLESIEISSSELSLSSQLLRDKMNLAEFS